MIICFKKDNIAYLAYDEMHSYLVGLSKEDRQRSNNVQIVIPKHRNKMVIAGMNMRLLDILRYEDIYDFKLTFESVHNDFVPKLKELSYQYRLVDKFGRLPSSIIFAEKDKIFRIDSDGLVMRVDDYTGIDTNAIITTHIETTKSLNSDETIKRIYNIYSSYMGTSCYPVYKIDTRNLQIDVIDI